MLAYKYTKKQLTRTSCFQVEFIRCFLKLYKKNMGLFDEYKKHPNEYVQERADSWCIAIGFQNVDGLNVSDYLIQLA